MEEMGQIQENEVKDHHLWSTHGGQAPLSTYPPIPSSQ